MKMPKLAGFHRPTLAMTVIIVLVLFVVYHLTLGKKRK